MANEKDIDFSEEQSFGCSSGYDNNEENNGVMVDKIGDYNEIGEEEVRVGTSVSNYFNDFTTRVVADYEANVDNNVRHACETSTANALPVCIALGGFWGRQQRVGNAGMAVGVGAGMAMAAGYGGAIGNVFGRIQTLCDAVEDVITGNDNH
ncbi:MAG: hypothetical protein K6F01_08730 [Selenomonas sp.]|uniref:hypothetical protein n=1 Tax=Selenomonas sp. TaxID=2053611 RepID=UPI0025D52A1E|nr:hypothetical protein [Selenomonas sp.]MCR5439499.1 hypothetical protein [Selenomonas sp.]